MARRPSHFALVFPLVVSAAVADPAQAGTGQAPRRSPHGPIYHTLDAVAGGLDFAVEKSLASGRWFSNRLLGRSSQRLCDALPCDGLDLDDPTLHSTWDGHLVPCDDRCDPRNLHPMPRVPMTGLTPMDAIESAPRRPSPSLAPGQFAPPSPDRDTPRDPSLSPDQPPASPERDRPRQPTPDDSDWFEDFRPSTPPRTRTSTPAKPKASDPFRDDTAANDPASKELIPLAPAVPKAADADRLNAEPRSARELKALPAARSTPATPEAGSPKRPTIEARPATTRENLLLPPANAR